MKALKYITATAVIASMFVVTQARAFDVEEYLEAVEDAQFDVEMRLDDVYERQDALSNQIDRAIDNDVSDAEFDRLMRLDDALYEEEVRIMSDFYDELDAIESTFPD